jgi:hypothetical protein
MTIKKKKKSLDDVIIIRGKLEEQFDGQFPLFIKGEDFSVGFGLNGKEPPELATLKDRKFKITIELDENTGGNEELSKEDKEDLDKFESDVTKNLKAIIDDKTNKGATWASSAILTTQSILKSIDIMKSKGIEAPTEKQQRALDNINKAALRLLNKEAKETFELS